jgi:hypothetical protein
MGRVQIQNERAATAKQQQTEQPDSERRAACTHASHRRRPLGPGVAREGRLGPGPSPSEERVPLRGGRASPPLRGGCARSWPPRRGAAGASVRANAGAPPGGSVSGPLSSWHAGGRSGAVAEPRANLKSRFGSSGPVSCIRDSYRYHIAFCASLRGPARQIAAACSRGPLRSGGQRQRVALIPAIASRRCRAAYGRSRGGAAARAARGVPRCVGTSPYRALPSHSGVGTRSRPVARQLQRAAQPPACAAAARSAAALGGGAASLPFACGGVPLAWQHSPHSPQAGRRQGWHCSP